MNSANVMRMTLLSALTLHSVPGSFRGGLGLRFCLSLGLLCLFRLGSLHFLIRNLNRRDCPLDSSLVSVDLTSDGISATGCPQRFALHYGCAFSRNDS